MRGKAKLELRSGDSRAQVALLAPAIGDLNQIKYQIVDHILKPPEVMNF